jgi:hypothetical protein
MTGGDHQSPGRAQLLHKHSAGWSGRDVRIKHTATGGLQAGNDGVPDHRAGRTPVPREDDGPTVKHRSQGTGKIDQVRGIEAVADHAPQSRDTENPLRHKEASKKVEGIEESKGSKRKGCGQSRFKNES